MERLQTISESLKINEAGEGHVFMIDHKGKGYLDVTKWWKKDLADAVGRLSAAMEGTGTNDVEIKSGDPKEIVDSLKGYKEHKNMKLTPELI
jgi:hypothetical protein